MDKNSKIMFVDDESDFIHPLAFWFKSKGYSISVFNNGEDALQTIKESPPDIVFLDILMPGMDGFEVLKKIREFNEKLPVIMMSAYMEDSRIDKTVDFYGISGTFYKGEDFEKALALVVSALKSQPDKK
jgi:CheY-like chemotaxis protein